MMEYRVLKDNELFLLTDQKGDIPLNHKYGLGLYKKDTRFLSELMVTINGEEPILLKSEAGETYESMMLLTNPHIEKDGEVELWRESVEVKRHRFIYSDVLYDKITLQNYSPKPVTFTVEFSFDVDFSDMFIVRGFQNGTTGKKLGVSHTDNDLVFSYVGADDIKRKTRVVWNEQEKVNVNDQTIQVPIKLDHAETKELTFYIIPSLAGEKIEVVDWSLAYERLREDCKTWSENVTKISTDHKSLQQLVDRGIQDLHALSTDVGYGPFFVAGLPWFGVPFGRDSLIAALQMLPFHPEIVRGTLRTMAHYQGTKKDSWRDEEPGKIMHEVRYGELANTNQVPFTPYYGSIDSTPLFLILVTEYIHWYKDMQLFEELENNIEAALEWIDQYGDRDGDGFVEYHQESSKGIANQGWKDSADSVVHRNGDFAESPIALAEVQGYVYQAKAGLAQIYEANGEEEKAKVLQRQADLLKRNFENAFWMEDKEFYAIALDKNKKQVGTLTSNPGHVLFSGILGEERAKKVMDTLVSPTMFSGYGIRTMGEGEAAYNPISYHDGSVWPHDNSMILLGMGLLKGSEQANKVISGLIESSHSFENQRLPELFCGYSRKEGKPVPYPVACSPQAWAAGTPLTFVRTMLGLYPNIQNNNQLNINPNLLPEMSELSLENLPLGDGYLSLTVRQDSSGHQVDVHKNTSGFLIQTAEHVSVNV